MDNLISEEEAPPYRAKCFGSLPTLTSHSLCPSDSLSSSAQISSVQLSFHNIFNLLFSSPQDRAGWIECGRSSSPTTREQFIFIALPVENKNSVFSYQSRWWKEDSPRTCLESVAAPSFSVRSNRSNLKLFDRYSSLSSRLLRVRHNRRVNRLPPTPLLLLDLGLYVMCNGKRVSVRLTRRKSVKGCTSRNLLIRNYIAATTTSPSACMSSSIVIWNASVWLPSDPQYGNHKQTAFGWPAINFFDRILSGLGVN